jgi:acyl-CoA thioesterase FadM
VNAREIKKASLVLFFRYFLKENNIYVGEGWQRLAFIDMRSGRPCDIPYFIRELAEAMEEKVSTMNDFVKR